MSLFLHHGAMLSKNCHSFNTVGEAGFKKEVFTVKFLEDV